MKQPVFYITILFCMITVHSNAQNYAWTKTLGADNSDVGESVAFDSQGNVITVGIFSDTADFDPGPGTANLIDTPGGFGSDFFVQKLDANGNYIWAYSFGSPNIEFVDNVLVDANDDIIVTGSFVNTVDFDPGVGTHTVTATGLRNGFILKLDNQGNFIWVKTIGGSTTSYIRSISSCFDSQGNIYTTGHFRVNADFDPGPGIFIITPNTTMGNNVGYVQKLDAQGNFIWAKIFDVYYLNASDHSNCVPYSIAVDLNDDVYITGQFNDTIDFDPGPGTYYLVGTGSAVIDAFITKLHNDGSFVWARELLGSGEQYARKIGFDITGNCYVVGEYTGTTDLDPGTGAHTVFPAIFGDWDAYLLKLDTQGNFQWAITHAGSGIASSFGGLTIDPTGNIYMAGTISNVCDVDPSPSAVYNLASNGWEDVSLCCYSPNGDLLWARSFGGISVDVPYDIKIDNNTGNMYITGAFYATVDFNFDAGTDNQTAVGTYDCFTMKLSVPVVWSIDEPNENIISVFPNPVQSVLQITSNSFQKGILEIFGADGKLVFSETNFSPSVRNDVNVSFLPAGTYVIRLTQKSKISSCRFIKN